MRGVKSHAILNDAHLSDVSFADRVEELRKQFGSDNAIARSIGVHSNTVTRWRHERRMRVSIEELRRLAEVSGKSADWLIGRGNGAEQNVTNARQRFIAGVDMFRLEQIFTAISGLGFWNRSTVEQKLADAAQIYKLLRGQDLTDDEIRRSIAQIRRRR